MEACLSFYMVSISSVTSFLSVSYKMQFSVEMKSYFSCSDFRE